MTVEILGLALDVLVLIGLGFTIVYAVRLSSSLAGFRAQRDEFMSMIVDLCGHIDQAKNAVDDLRDLSRDSGRVLQDKIDEARSLAQDLQRPPSSFAKHPQQSKTERPPLEKTPSRPPLPAREPLSPPPRAATPFFIHDRDFEFASSSTPKPEEEDDFSDDQEDDAAFQSTAERELFAALQKHRKASGQSMI